MIKHAPTEAAPGTPLGTMRAKRQERRSRATTLGPSITVQETASTKSTEKTQTTERKAQPVPPDVSIAEKLLEAKRKRTQR